MIKNILARVNAYYEEKYGEAHVELSLPNLYIFHSWEKKVQATLGTTHENAALFIASACMESPLTHANQRDFALLITLKLVQAYHAQRWSNPFISIGTNLLLMVESLQATSNWFYKGMGYLLMESAKFALLGFKAVERSYIYKSATALLGEGFNLHDTPTTLPDEMIGDSEGSHHSFRGFRRKDIPTAIEEKTSESAFTPIASINRNSL